APAGSSAPPGRPSVPAGVEKTLAFRASEPPASSAPLEAAARPGAPLYLKVLALLIAAFVALAAWWWLRAS
ncbi:MAG TPA: hypothetical protein VGK73_32880, partial [Polyangiaceae bacterium]